MPPTTLNLAVETSQDPKALKFEAERLICCGWDVIARLSMRTSTSWRSLAYHHRNECPLTRTSRRTCSRRSKLAPSGEAPELLPILRSCRK
jgi:hypothetical protein